MWGSGDGEYGGYIFVKHHGELSYFDTIIDSETELEECLERIKCEYRHKEGGKNECRKRT
jgi:hypothetical protein